MLSNRQKIYNVVSAHLQAREFSRRDLLGLIDKDYPGTNHESILPSDYLCKDAVKGDPSNDGNRNYRTYPRFLERLGRDRYKFVGWDGIDRGSLDAPVTRAVAGNQQNRAVSLAAQAPQSAMIFAPRTGNNTTDDDSLVAELRRLAPSVRKSVDRAWRREPALRVIDCVLSLNRHYDSFVVPRLDDFERRHPDIRTISDLQGLMARFRSPNVFVSDALDYRHEDRAETLNAVVNWLATVSGGGSYERQIANLQRWANQALPGDFKLLRIAGFGLAGFQYLRMLFGANTTKPDIHICRYVSGCVGHPVADIEALLLLERAAVEAGVPLRDLDTTIWEGSARASG